MEKTKLFYKDENGEDTFLIAEGEDEAKAAENAVKEYQILQEIFCCDTHQLFVLVQPRKRFQSQTSH